MWNTCVQKYTSHRSDSQYWCRYSRKKTWHPTATAKHRQQRYRSIAENCHSFNSTEICLGNELVNLLVVLFVAKPSVTLPVNMNMIQKSIFVNRSCSNNNNSNNNRNCISSDSTVQGVILWHSLFTGIQSKNINKNMSFHMCAVGLHRIISTGSPLGTSGCSTQLILEGHVASYLQDRTYLQASRQASVVGGTTSSLAGTSETSLGPRRD